MLDLRSYRDAYANGATPSDLIAAALARLARLDDPGIFLHLIDADALAAAVEALGPFDPLAKPLWGVPFAVKDNIDVAGMPTTAACPAYAYTPAEDATVVARLRAAGAIPIGKTNLDQFATGLVGVRSPYPIPKNALNPDLVPGGSSSGSAVAVAQGLVPFALGTDTAGSGRVPAALNGIVGLKPSLGALSARGVVPACRSLDCVSIFAGSVEDAAAVFRCASAFDAEDPYSREVVQSDCLPKSLAGSVIGVPQADQRPHDGDTEAAAAFEAAVAALREAGAEVREVPFADLFAIAELLYEGPWVAERHAAIRDFFDATPEALHPVTRQIVGKACGFTATDTFQAQYKLADLRRAVEPLLASVDFLCVPTIPRNATVAEVEAEPIAVNSMLGTYTNFVNLLDLCGIAVPQPPDASGAPRGVTLLARAGADLGLAAIAASFEACFGEKEAVDLVVVGAHLSGMALNHQLQDLGAAFVEATETAPSYTLYALPNTAPPKPGMVRVPEEQGHAIKVEVWRLSPAAFGTFVAAIPAPLGIGDVTLADGRRVKGFLAEGEGVRGADDISHFGGWRAFAESG